MPISVECPQCSKAYRVGDDKAGKRMKCKECDAVVAIPEEELIVLTEVDEDEYEPLPPRRKSSGSKSRKKPAKKSSAFTSPVQLAVGGVVVVVAVGVVLWILSQRETIDGGSAAEAQNSKKARQQAQ